MYYTGRGKEGFSMKTVEFDARKDRRKEKQLWKQLEKVEKQNKPDSKNLKQFRMVQSVKAGHIRGGHAFH
jgi:hypothetical protein